MIVTVCDNAANEVCPIWPGHPVQAHWGLPDPASVEGGGQRAAFEAAYDALKTRIDALVKLPVSEMSPSEARAAIQAIHDNLT